MLTEKEQKALDRMERQVQMPKWKYVFIYGVLLWGITTAIFYTTAMSLIRGRTLSDVLGKDIWISLVTFMLGGIFFGLIIRRLIPRYIQSLKDKQILP